MCVLCIDGQTAGPIGLTFFVGTHGWSGGDIYFYSFIRRQRRDAS